MKEQVRLIAQQRCNYVVVPRVFPATPPLSRLFVHDQRDVALDQGEGEEADVAGVLAGCSGLLWPGGKGTKQSVALAHSLSVVSSHFSHIFIFIKETNFESFAG